MIQTLNFSFEVTAIPNGGSFAIYSQINTRFRIRKIIPAVSFIGNTAAQGQALFTAQVLRGGFVPGAASQPSNPTVQNFLAAFQTVGSGTFGLANPNCYADALFEINIKSTSGVGSFVQIYDFDEGLKCNVGDLLVYSASFLGSAPGDLEVRSIIVIDDLRPDHF